MEAIITAKIKYTIDVKASLTEGAEQMSDITKKQIAIGVEDFKEIIDKNGYFVDKTMLIKELLDSRAKITSFTRPRRFGKTLNRFMICRFFEDEITKTAGF